MKSKLWICEVCAQVFGKEVDLLAHQFNSHCEVGTDLICPCCGREEEEPFDVGDECYCGEKFTSKLGEK